MTKSRHSKKSKRRDDQILRREVAAIRRLKKRAASHGKAFLADIVLAGGEAPGRSGAAAV